MINIIKEMDVVVAIPWGKVSSFVWTQLYYMYLQ